MHTNCRRCNVHIVHIVHIVPTRYSSAHNILMFDHTFGPGSCESRLDKFDL